MTSPITVWARPAVLLTLLVAISATLVTALPPGSFVAATAIVLASALTGAIALLDRVRDQARSLRALGERLAASAEARSRETARADDALAKLANLQAQLVVADRRISLGRLAAGVGHEIANPLAFVAGNLEWIESELERRRARLAAEPPSAKEVAGCLDEMTRAVQEALQGAERVRRMLHQLKTFARGRDDEPPIPLQVGEAVEVAIEMARHETKHRARLVRDFGPAPLVVANAVQLAQVFVNLIVNAAHAVRHGAADKNEIRVAIGTDAAGWATVAVSDTGCGIPEDARARLFEPFFTTKPADEGSGLGLSISQEIVRAVGGEIGVESAPGAGATFTVRLPPCAAGATTPVPGRAAPTPPPRARRILVVDDEPLVLSTLARLMGTWGEVRTAGSGRAALELLRGGERFDVVLSDVMMPEMTGVDLYRTVEAEAPQQAARFVFVTGGAHDPSAREFLDAWRGPWLFKPLNLEKLRSLIHERRW